jgi:apolipoprotein D and lipocalin family protein
MGQPLNRLAAAAVAIAAAAAAFGAGAAEAPSPTKPVDMAKLYTGTWAEIGRRPMSLTDGCVAGATTYTPKGGDKIDVRDTCHTGSPTGPEKAIGGPAQILDPGTNAKLHVSYRFAGFIPIGRDYWVLDHADDYSWFISADPKFENLWIYARDPRISADQIKVLVGKAQALGYDTSKLEFPAQP